MKFSGRLGQNTGPNSIAALTASIAARGGKLINLSDSNPTRHGLSPDGVLSLLSDRASLEYRPEPRGLLSARNALSERFGGDAASYFLSASTSEAYGWLFKLLCDPGDSVLVPKPGYPLFDSLAGLESIRAVPYRLEYSHPGGWAIDPDHLRAAAEASDARALILINPNNPTGSYVSGKEREAVVSLCAERGMALISDEVFFPYDVEAEEGRSSLGGERACLTFVLDGLSKLLCLPQLKLGWLRVSGPALAVEEASARLEIIADTYLSAGAPVMNALPALLDRADGFTGMVRERLARNLSSARSIFGGEGSPYRVLRCDGGWTALLEYPRYATEEETVLGLLRDERIAVQPGYFFDMERDGYLALSLILEPDSFEQAARRVRRYIDALPLGHASRA